MKKLVTLILALAMTATAALSVSAADASTVTKGKLLSEDEVAAVKANSEKIAMDAGSMTMEGVAKTYGEGDDSRYSLFDDDADLNDGKGTRFALDATADNSVVLVWSIADTSKPEVPGYLVLTTGYNSAQWNQRRATEFKFYGAAADGKWVELAAGGEMMEGVDKYSYGIELVDTAAFTQYKLEFKCASDGTNLAFQLNDLSVYAADPETSDPGTQDPTTQDPGTQDPTTQDPGTQDPTTQDPGKTPESNPKTGSASVVIAAVAVVALAGFVVATKKREQD